MSTALGQSVDHNAQGLFHSCLSSIVCMFTPYVGYFTSPGTGLDTIIIEETNSFSVSSERHWRNGVNEMSTKQNPHFSYLKGFSAIMSGQMTRQSSTPSKA